MKKKRKGNNEFWVILEIIFINKQNNHNKGQLTIIY